MGRIIDGKGWINERLRFLRERLSEVESEDERHAIEAEIEALSREAGRGCAGWSLGLRDRIPRRR